MPGMDGTGPMGFESRTGRGAGWCVQGAAVGRGLGRGYGRGLGLCRFAATDSRAALTAQKAILRERLNALEERLRENP